MKNSTTSEKQKIGDLSNFQKNVHRVTWDRHGDELTGSEDSSSRRPQKKNSSMKNENSAITVTPVAARINRRRKGTCPLSRLRARPAFTSSPSWLPPEDFTHFLSSLHPRWNFFFQIYHNKINPRSLTRNSRFSTAPLSDVKRASTGSNFTNAT